MSIYHEIDVHGKNILQRIASIDEEPHRGIIDKGRILYSKSDESVYYGTTTAWVKLPGKEGVFKSGIKILMSSYPLPQYFQIDTTTAWDQMMVMFTDKLSDVGKTPDASWIISGIQKAGKHYHGQKTGKSDKNVSVGKSDVYTQVGSYLHRHHIEIDGDHFHSFDGTWRPTHTKYFVVEYIPT